MTIEQMFVALVCVFLTTQQITAVVNNQKQSNVDATTPSTNSSSDSESSSTKVADSIPAGTEKEAKRRDAPGGTYGAPLTGGGLDSYVPSGPSNPSLPIPVYGVPNAPSNHLIYPAPPPDIPPPLPQVSQVYGAPFPVYGPPQPVNDFVPPPLPSKSYGPPFRPPKPFIHPKPRPVYGLPKPIFVPKPPKPQYGPPKPLFQPQKHNFQQSVTILTVPSKEYGVPSPSSHYGPPEPIPHGPPHPGVPAPPTPPDIKYDGWQPIPGLVSRPPSSSYGVPEGQSHNIRDLQFNSDFTPPPVSGGHSISAGFSSSLGLSDSYDAPLNAVTGSGGVVSSSGESHHDSHSLSLGLSAAGINSGQSHLSVIKSIGYELFPHSDGKPFLSNLGGGDSYSSPPLSSYSPNGPYAAAHPHKSHGLSSGPIKSHHYHPNSGGSHGLSLSSSGIGLLPPSGFYGRPPSSHYGTPLLNKAPHPLNALKINPPKRPVIFREPVPAGLIESIGQHTAHKDAHGIIENAHSGSFNSEPTYIPPPVPDVTKPVREEPPEPSHLYSLPNVNSAISFQNVGHGSFGISGFDGGHSGTLTSYTAPLGSIDGSYSLPLHSGAGYSIGLDNTYSDGLTVGIDNSHPPLSIDLTSSTTNLNPRPTFHHDCSLHTSQALPSFSYGVPSANSYTAALSSLTTNIGGSSVLPDLQVAHSQKINTGTATNAIETESHGKSYGKSLAQNFGPNTELIQSDSININNIPIRGTLGTYTLQIQPAEGLGGPDGSVSQIQHAQVLNDGLLESILAAIEQPQQKEATILGQPLLRLQPPTPQSLEYQSDADSQHSVTNAVVVSPPVTEATTSSSSATFPTQESDSDTNASLRLIDNNEIALYFSNNSPSDDSNHVNNTADAVRNGQQYGSYVSFKTPNASFVYGKLPKARNEKLNQSGEDKD